MTHDGSATGEAATTTHTTLVRGSIVTDGRVTHDAWTLLAAGHIAGTGTGEPPSADEVVEATWVTPGFVDMHCHGGAGGAFEDDDVAIERALAFHRAHGTTRSMLSLVTAGLDDLAARAGRVARLAHDDDRVLGVHLEGPCLSPERRGAHDSELLRTPDAATIEALLAATRGARLMVTLAPELPGGIDAVRRLTAGDAVVAIGHTDATLDVGRASIEAGATVVTHAFNAMRGLDHRTPGVLPAAFDDERVTIEAIADGIHVHPRMVRMLLDEAPGRVALVTDAMAAAGQPDGRWTLGSLEVEVQDGVPRLTSNGSIAGSTLTLDRAVRTLVDAGVPLEVAIDAATRVPSRALGVGHLHGSIAQDRAADVVALDERLEVAAVWSRGERVAA